MRLLPRAVARLLVVARVAHCDLILRMEGVKDPEIETAGPNGGLGGGAVKATGLALAEGRSGDSKAATVAYKGLCLFTACQPLYLTV
jgi:hypothetical protein